MLVDSITAAGVAVISNRSRVNASAAHAIPYATSKSSVVTSIDTGGTIKLWDDGTDVTDDGSASGLFDMASKNLGF